MIESSNNVIVDRSISESEAKDLTRRYGDLVNALLEELLSQNLSISGFYQKLWHVITSSPSFNGNDNAKIFAVYYTWVDERIPYFQLESVLFILCLEGYFVEDTDIIKIYRKFQLGSLIFFVSFLILYCVFFFSPELFSLISEGVRFWYNIVLIGATVVLGILCNGAISMKASVIA